MVLSELDTKAKDPRFTERIERGRFVFMEVPHSVHEVTPVEILTFGKLIQSAQRGFQLIQPAGFMKVHQLHEVLRRNALEPVLEDKLQGNDDTLGDRSQAES